MLFSGFVPACQRYLLGIKPTRLKPYAAPSPAKSIAHIFNDFFQLFFLFGHFLICVFLCLEVAQVIPPVVSGVSEHIYEHMYYKSQTQ